MAGQHGRRVILVSGVLASFGQYGWAGEYFALRSQIKQDPSRTDPVDSERVFEEMGHLAPRAAQLPEISEVPVLSVVLDTLDIEVLAQEERAVGSFADLEQPVLLNHWNLSYLAPCLV